MDLTDAIGLVAAPGIIAGVIGAVKPLWDRVGLPHEAIPALALIMGVAYTITAWLGGIIDIDNVYVAILLGLTVGIGAPGVRETIKGVRQPEGS